MNVIPNSSMPLNPLYCAAENKAKLARGSPELFE